MRISTLPALLLSAYAASSFFGLSFVAACGRSNPIIGHGRNGDYRFYLELYHIGPGVFGRQPELVPILALGPSMIPSY